MKSFSKHSRLLRLKNVANTRIKFWKQNIRDFDQKNPIWETAEGEQKSLQFFFAVTPGELQ